MRKQYLQKKGFSVIEVLLASAVFVLFSTGIVMVLLQSLILNRLGEEEAIANQYAVEGIEATRSIRNQSFDALGNTQGTGISRLDGAWVFSGQNNVLDGKYQRVIEISDAERNGSDIVESGGTADTDTKKVIVTVTWAGPSQENSVVLITYLTRWKSVL